MLSQAVCKALRVLAESSRQAFRIDLGLAVVQPWLEHPVLDEDEVCKGGHIIHCNRCFGNVLDVLTEASGK